MKNYSLAIISLCLLGASAAPVYAQATLGTSGAYSENFDSMGTTGTAAPTGWAQFITAFTGSPAQSNSTWTNATGIPTTGATGINAIPVTTPATTLTATSAPTATNNNGYNAAMSSSATSDRVLSTSPTTNAGCVLQLTLQNTTGAALSSLSVSYDIVRFTVGVNSTSGLPTDNELPGYQLFYSVDGGSTFTNVAALNPVISGTSPQIVVPNTVGVTTVPTTTFALSSAVANGSTIYMRWVDDNANQTSPDQIIGLNNVVVSNAVSSGAAPDASTLSLMGMALAGVALPLRRRIAHR